MGEISRKDRGGTMNQGVYNERLLDFLLYSYFGCGSEELAQEGLRQCAYRAYLDLSRKVGFLLFDKRIKHYAE